MTDRDAYAHWYADLAGGSPVVPVERVYPHPLPARLAARMTEAPPADRDVRVAWWDGLDPAVRDALRTLSLARGPMGIATWRVLHTRLHPEEPRAATAVEAAATWLEPRSGRFETHHLVPGAPGDPATPELFDALLTMVPLTPQGRPDWEHAPSYLLDHLIDHAPGPRAAGRLRPHQREVDTSRQRGGRSPQPPAGGAPLPGVCAPRHRPVHRRHDPPTPQVPATANGRHARPTHEGIT